VGSNPTPAAVERVRLQHSGFGSEVDGNQHGEANQQAAGSHSGSWRLQVAGVQLVRAAGLYRVVGMAHVTINAAVTDIGCLKVGLVRVPSFMRPQLVRAVNLWKKK
jgi:hypothetical protein